jgi:CubicO group peptidase (beta-lactamase class C family)
MKGQRARLLAIALLAVVVLLLVVAVVVFRVDRALRIATGFVSYTMCAETFVSGIPAPEVYAETIRPVPAIAALGWALRHEVDVSRRQVRTTALGAFESRAAYHDGRGCIVEGETEATDATVPRDILTLPGSPALLPEIAGPAPVAPINDELRAAVDAAFAEPDGPPYRWTKAVIIAHDGRIVAEKYAPGVGIDTPLLGYSATKSVVNALIGVLVREKRLSVGQPAPVAAWRDPADRRHAITIDHLLRMTSGLALGNSLEERHKGWDPSARMLFIERDKAGFAESVALESAPGSAWNYADGNTVILSRIIRHAVGGHAEDVLRFARHELFDPLGMRTVTFPFDATGTPLGSSAMLASARDWARFGLLYLNDGVVGERRILPEGWVRYSSTPTPVAWIGYGAGWWTNVGSSEGATRRRTRGMPPDSFFASGLLGQYVVVAPSARLVVVRLGVSHGPRGDIVGTSQLVADAIAAPASRSR